MTVNQQYGLEPISGQSNLTGLGGLFPSLVETGSSFLKSGDCAVWDEQCQINQALQVQAELEKAKAANLLAEQKATQGNQQMLIMAAGGFLVVIAVFALLMKGK